MRRCTQPLLLSIISTTLLSTNAAFVREASACYAIIVGRGASADGSVLVGHAEQNWGERILNFRRIPAREFSEGATVTLRRGGRLSQIERTASFLWSQNPGQEFSDAYCNEYGVIVVSDSCPTREDSYEELVARGEIRDGGIGYMLRRLIAERAKTAREGVELAGRLVERFGYVHSGRTYVIADPNEAWMVAVVRGRRWVAQRVPDDMVVLLPNIHIIGEVDLEDTDNFLGSSDLIDYAANRGWFDPKSGKLNFRKAYRSGEDRPDARRHQGRSLVVGRREPWPGSEPPPIGVKPKEKMTVATVAKILRDTTGSGRAISIPQTQEGAVFQLRADMPRDIGCVYWRTTAEPSTSVFLPFYCGITETPKSFYLPIEIERQLTLQYQFNPPRGTFTPKRDLAWWMFKRLQDYVRADYRTRVKAIAPAWERFEQELFIKQHDVEAKALELWESTPDTAREFLTQHCSNTAAEAMGKAAALTK